jgi:hypothetical protein
MPIWCKTVYIRYYTQPARNIFSTKARLKTRGKNLHLEIRRDALDIALRIKEKYAPPAVEQAHKDTVQVIVLDIPRPKRDIPPPTMIEIAKPAAALPGTNGKWTQRQRIEWRQSLMGSGVAEGRDQSDPHIQCTSLHRKSNNLRAMPPCAKGYSDSLHLRQPHAAHFMSNKTTP